MVKAHSTDAGFARRQGKFYMNYLYNDHRVSIENASPESNPDLNGYGDYLFFQYLARSYQPQTIAQIFDATIGMASVEAMAADVDSKGGMKAIWPAFALTLWNDDVGQVLDYWNTQDSYDIGLAGIYSPRAGMLGASAKLKTLEIDQNGQPRASFKLFDNTLVGANYEFQPRSTHYEHLKFSDDTVHSVYLNNPIANFPNREFMKVQVKKKICGTPQPVDSIARATTVAMVVKSLMPGRIAFGTSGGQIRGDSRVVPGPGCLLTSVGASRNLYRGLGGLFIAGDDGSIDVNLDLDLGFGQIGGTPPDRKLIQLSGFSFLDTTHSLVCPQVNQVSTGSQGWEWLHVDDPSRYSVSADGQTIEGRFTATLATGAVIDSQWKFTAVKE